MAIQRFAIIDIGTVTCRLYVADVIEGALKKLCQRCTITNLGTQVSSTKRLSPEALQRVKVCMEEYQSLINSYREDKVDLTCIAVATSAARDAENSDELIKLLEEKDIKLTIISGKQEARFSFIGATASLPAAPVLVIDIGGGSTEIIAGEAGKEPKQIHSFDIGCRRVTELFLHSNPISPEQEEKAKSWIKKEMLSYFEAMKNAGFSPEKIVAVAGTATSIASMDLALEEYDPNRVHQHVVSKETLDKLTCNLEAMSLEDRKKVVGLQPKRAAVIVAGLYILQVILELAAEYEFMVSESDSLEGIIWNHLNKADK